jgi:large subunit ribosomal protein L14
MILTSTVILTMDNSGARRVRCLKVYKKPGRGKAFVGDLIKVIIIQLRNRGLIRVKKGDIQVAVVSRVSTPIFRVKKGYFFKFDLNSVVLLNKKNLPVGTRIFGPTCKELRSKNYSRITTLATNIL